MLLNLFSFSAQGFHKPIFAFRTEGQVLAGASMMNLATNGVASSAAPASHSINGRNPGKGYLGCLALDTILMQINFSFSFYS